jgi:hypothetical protein
MVLLRSGRQSVGQGRSNELESQHSSLTPSVIVRGQPGRPSQGKSRQDTPATRRRGRPPKLQVLFAVEEGEDAVKADIDEVARSVIEDRVAQLKPVLTEATVGGPAGIFKVPSVEAIAISASSWPSDVPGLHLLQSNWIPWSKTLHDIIDVHSLSQHLSPSIKPDSYSNPIEYRNWELNDAVVKSFIILHLSETEKDFVNSQSFSSAYSLYEALCVRHTHLDEMTRMSLIREVFQCLDGRVASAYSTGYRRDEDDAETFDDLQRALQPIPEAETSVSSLQAPSSHVAYRSTSSISNFNCSQSRFVQIIWFLFFAVLFCLVYRCFGLFSVAVSSLTPQAPHRSPFIPDL